MGCYNDPKYLARQFWAYTVDPDPSGAVILGCRLSFCIIWTQYCMAKPHYSNFRVSYMNWVFKYFGFYDTSGISSIGSDTGGVQHSNR